MSCCVLMHYKEIMTNVKYNTVNALVFINYSFYGTS